MTNEDIINELDPEVKRFYKIWKEYKNKVKNEYEYNSRSFAKIKRASMDIKQELTKITQSSKYKWDR